MLITRAAQGPTPEGEPPTGASSCRHEERRVVMVSVRSTWVTCITLGVLLTLLAAGRAGF